MTPDQKSKMSKYAYAGDDMKKLFLETANTEDIKTMVKKNAEMTRDIIYRYFDNNNIALRNTLKPETFTFLNANMRIQTGRQQYFNQQNPPPGPPPGP